jgi:hypothetical protein
MAEEPWRVADRNGRRIGMFALVIPVLACYSMGFPV